jgi:hypothetical protein
MRWFGRRDRDYREELETHIDMEIRANLERGMAPDAARQAALRTFGNVLIVREELQEARPFSLWGVLLKDVRYGTRLLIGRSRAGRGWHSWRDSGSDIPEPPHDEITIWRSSMRLADIRFGGSRSARGCRCRELLASPPGNRSRTSDRPEI